MLRVLAASITLFLILAAAARFRDLIELPLRDIAFNAGFRAKEISVLLVCAVGAWPIRRCCGLRRPDPAEIRGALKRKKSDPVPLPEQ
jgi:hypothetical protein